MTDYAHTNLTASSALHCHTLCKELEHNKQIGGAGSALIPVQSKTHRRIAMAAKVKPVPEGYHTVTPYLVADGAEKIIRFMKEAFGAQPVFEPMMRPDGKIMHAEFKIGDSIVMISDTSERAQPTSVMLNLYVPDVDAVYQKALKAGAT